VFEKLPHDRLKIGTRGRSGAAMVDKVYSIYHASGAVD